MDSIAQRNTMDACIVTCRKGLREDGDAVDTDRLLEFVKVVDLGSVTRAASVLGMGQPTLSKHLQDLEAQFGVRLLERVPGGVRPTAAGNVLYAEAADVANRTAMLEARMRALRGRPMRTLRVACYQGYEPTDDAVALAVERMQERDPGVLVEVVDLRDFAGSSLEALRDGRLDLCLTLTPASADLTGLARVELLRDRLVVLARNDTAIARKRQASVADLRGEVLWVPDEPGQPYSERLVELAGACGLTFVRYARGSAVPGASGVSLLNVDKGGCALIFRSMVKHMIPHVRRASYTVVEVADDAFDVPVDLVRRAGDDPAVDLLAQTLLAEAASINPAEYE